MNDAKYIVIENEYSGPDIIVFPNYINHMDIVLQMNIDRKFVRSAGFVCFSPEESKFYCYGESKSIGVECDPELDNKLIKKLFRV
ncbi:MAG: hypothetical protein RBT49_08495 [Bacteroidales bacterium]|jgi:hypothetical protein|nr:hypothetical protein [Bacteroidales bacterium]